MTVESFTDARPVDGREAAPGVVLDRAFGHRALSRTSPRSRQALRRQQWVVPVVMAALVAAAVGADPVASAIALVVWVSHHFLTDRWWLHAACPPSLVEVARRVAWPIAVVALVVAAGWVPYSWLAPTVLVAGVAGIAQVVVVAACRRIGGPPRVLVVGEATDAHDLVARWAARADVVVTACVPLDDQVPRLALDRRVDAVVVVPSTSVAPIAVRRLGWTLERLGVSMVVGTSLDFVAPHRLAVTALAGGVFVDIASSRPAPHVRLLKAVMDRAGALLLLVVLSPLLAVLVLLVRLDSPGPAIFTQIRVGQDGRTFRLHKLRTMRTDAETVREELLHLDEGHGVLFKIQSDPRITRVGHVLRRTSLDELPQLINVLRGEMSLVGPRPALPHEVARYDDVARRRLAVRPGMTGMWQVSGRSDLDWDTSVALDLGYTDNVSVAGDLGICLRTVRAVVSGRGAY